MKALLDRSYFCPTHNATLGRYLQRSSRNVGILGRVVHRASMSASVNVVGMWAGTRCLLRRPVFGLQVDGARNNGSWSLCRYDDNVV